MGTCLGDSLVGPLFVLAHFHVLCYYLKVFNLCFFFLHFFPSLANNTHILGLTHVITLVFNRFPSHLASIGLFVQPHKCLAWAPFGFTS
jgi:hypothetical protein